MAGTAALLAAGAGGARASGPLLLDWADLVPRGEGQSMDELRTVLGIVEHGELSTGFDQERDASVTTEYNGKRVSLPGFMVPLDYSGSGVTTFLLVPYVGACIHVPPPPPNQIIYVEAVEPYEVVGFFEAITVTGTMATTAVATDLAEIGYVMADAEVEPYE